jgi:hypothetical protein
MRTALACLLALVLTPAAALAQSMPAPSVEARLCRSQLELLTSGNKLTPEEIARFESQCACLEDRADTGDTAQCTQPRKDQ